MHVYVSACGCMHVCVCNVHKSKQAVRCLLSIVALFSWDKVSHWIWGSLFWLGGLAGKLLVSTWLCQCWGYRHMWPCLVLMWVLGIQTLVLRLAQPVFLTHQAISPALRLCSPTAVIVLNYPCWFETAFSFTVTDRRAAKCSGRWLPELHGCCLWLLALPCIGQLPLGGCSIFLSLTVL